MTVEVYRAYTYRLYVDVNSEMSTGEIVNA